MVRLAVLLALMLGACANGPLVQRWSAAPISSPDYESHPMFDPQTGDLYFVRGAPDFSAWRLMLSACHGHRYAPPQPPPFAAEGATEADPFFTPDGRTLYFISSRPYSRAPQTNLDIWRVTRDGNGVWGAPEHLPAPINSEGQEWYPRLAADGWLYFGSSRPGGHGRTDIYRGKPDGVGGWRVENLGDAINTPGDEYEADFSADGNDMLLMGDGDLYSSHLRGGHWTARERLGPEVNTQAMEVGGLLSSDARAFFFSHDSGDPTLSGEIYLHGRAYSFPPRCRR